MTQKNPCKAHSLCSCFASCQPIDRCKLLVNNVIILDLLTFVEILIIFLLHFDALIYDFDWLRSSFVSQCLRDCSTHGALSIQLLILIYWQRNFPFVCGPLASLYGRRNEEFQLSHHSVPESILQSCRTSPDPSIKLSMNTRAKIPKNNPDTVVKKGWRNSCWVIRLHVNGFERRIPLLGSRCDDQKS